MEVIIVVIVAAIIIWCIVRSPNGSGSSNTRDPSVSTAMKVDLGLSVKWAGYNVGGQSPEDYGAFFQFGGLNQTSNYCPQNCITYGVRMGDISGNSEYDAASYYWRGGWRMPTPEECHELVDKTYAESIKYCGVWGVKFTSKINGNAIFIPSAGMMINTSHEYNHFQYWTGCPHSTDLNEAAVFVKGAEYTSGFSCSSELRCIGRPIRAVSNY